MVTTEGEITTTGLKTRQNNHSLGNTAQAEQKEHHVENVENKHENVEAVKVSETQSVTDTEVDSVSQADSDQTMKSSQSAIGEMSDPVRRHTKEKSEDLLQIQKIINSLENDIKRQRNEILSLKNKLDQNPDFVFIKDDINNIEKNITQLEGKLIKANEEKSRIIGEMSDPVRRHIKENSENLLQIQEIITSLENDIKRHRNEILSLKNKLDQNPDFVFIKDDINNIEKKYCSIRR